MTDPREYINNMLTDVMEQADQGSDFWVRHASNSGTHEVGAVQASAAAVDPDDYDCEHTRFAYHAAMYALERETDRERLAKHARLKAIEEEKQRLMAELDPALTERREGEK